MKTLSSKLRRIGTALAVALALSAPRLALAAPGCGDPFDNLLSNAALALQRWGVKGAVLVLIVGFVMVGWASREGSPEMRGAGWRTVVGALFAGAGCAVAPSLATLVIGWAGGTPVSC